MDKPVCHNVFLGLGTNLGNREKNIHQALQYIEERIGKVVACSALFTTQPVGFESNNLFINAACHVQSTLRPLDILETTKQIELDMGRTSKSTEGIYTDRIIDIDILLYDDLVVDYPQLILPHPRIAEREFVLLPLTEIAKDIEHPLLKKKIGELVVKRS